MDVRLKIPYSVSLVSYFMERILVLKQAYINHLTDCIKKTSVIKLVHEKCLVLALFGAVNVAKQFDSEYRRSIIINSVCFCGAFELALRLIGYNQHGMKNLDSSSNPGIFWSLNNFSSELDMTLKNYVEMQQDFKGKFKIVQNKLLSTTLEVCCEKITQK